MTVISERPSRAVARCARRLLCGGTGLFAIGLMTGLALILHYFFVTPFAICSAALSTMRFDDAWPWALPLLAVEGVALGAAALGLALLAPQTRSIREG